MPSRAASAAMASLFWVKLKWPRLMSRMKCLATLCFPATLPTRSPILTGSTSRPACTWAWMRPSGLGGIDQLAAFAGPLLCQGGVAAADQPLPGIVRVADLGQVLLIEQRQLQRPILSGQRGHRRGAQRAHPAEPAGRPQRLDAGGGEHATIPDDD